MEPHVQQGLSRRAFLDRKQALKDEMTDIEKAEEKKSFARKISTGFFTRTDIGKRRHIRHRTEDAIARARLQRKQRAQYRKHKTLTRRQFAAITMKKAKLQIKEESPGVFSVRATGMTGKVQKLSLIHI